MVRTSWPAFDALAPTTTRGDIITRGASANGRLAVGTSGYHLSSDGTDPSWVGFLQSGTGAVTRTWQDKNSDIVSVLDFGAVSGIGASTKVAAVNYALSILVNNTGYTFNEVKLDCFPLGPFNCAGPGKDKLTDLVGSGDVLGGEGLTNGFGARSDIDVKVNVVPEPGSLALLSLALAGLGFVTRRRSV